VQIFLSYRRGDVGGYAGRLADALRERLGAKSVFQDVTAIAPGQDYTAVIDRALDGCDAVLVVIGPGWLAAASPQNTPRLFEADDYVRMELSRALNRNVRVIPVLVGGAGLPAATELPDELQGLVHRQAVVLHDETWHQDVEGLLRSLRGQPAVPAKPRRRWQIAGGVAAALIALAVLGAAAGWWGPGRSDGSGTGDQGGSESGILSCAAPKGQGWSPIALNNDPTGEEKLPNGSLVFKVKDAYWRAREGKWQVILATSMENATSEPAYHGDWRYSSLVVGQREFKATCFAPTPNLVTSQTVGDALIGFEVTCEPVGYIQLILEDEKARISVTDDALEPGAC
jgi:TIR domain-containing protein